MSDDTVRQPSDETNSSGPPGWRHKLAQLWPALTNKLWMVAIPVVIAELKRWLKLAS